MYKILIVEDDEIIAAEIGRHLEKWGYETEAVTDFSNVLGSFGRFMPHLVLMDIGLFITDITGAGKSGKCHRRRLFLFLRLRTI